MFEAEQTNGLEEQLVSLLVFIRPFSGDVARLIWSSYFSSSLSFISFRLTELFQKNHSIFSEKSYEYTRCKKVE